MYLACNAGNFGWHPRNWWPGWKPGECAVMMRRRDCRLSLWRWHHGQVCSACRGDLHSHPHHLNGHYRYCRRCHPRCHRRRLRRHCDASVPPCLSTRIGGTCPESGFPSGPRPPDPVLMLLVRTFLPSQRTPPWPRRLHTRRWRRRQRQQRCRRCRRRSCCRGSIYETPTRCGLVAR